MNIITSPSVHVLSWPRFEPHPEYEVPDVDKQSTTYAQEQAYSIIAHAGKGCYDSYGKDGRSIEDHIRSLITSKHGSVLEHVHIGLFISGISRGCSHEVVRHRHFNYSQRSTRYTAEEGASIVLDPYYSELYQIRQDVNLSFKEGEEDIIEEFLLSCTDSIDVYARAVEQLMHQAPPDKTKHEQRKWARGKARQLLPHALETRMTVTGNLRAWRHWLETRSHNSAEPEIRRLAEEIFDTIQPLAPLAFADYVVTRVDGFIELTSEHMKI